LADALLKTLEVLRWSHAESFFRHPDYFFFEQKFRRPFKDVKQSFRKYIKYFKNCKLVIDIGCGRGEFLELLKETGIPAYGLEINKLMINECKKRGLKVVDENLFSHLEGLKAESVDGFFCAHLIEHLELEEMLTLFRLVHEKLSRNGVFILETLNSKALAILSERFYVDPSHRNPLNPEALSEILTLIGFRTKINYSFPFKKKERLCEIKLPSEIQFNSFYELIKILNENFRKLNSIIFGNRYYAIIAKKCS
jgi:O-antigen chain-terminating methyltransferase